MAEDESDQESERLGEELVAIAEEDLRDIGPCHLKSKEYCRRFCEVVEDYTARWQVPLPQLQVLQTALCCFTSASVSFPVECEHVQYVLSRLALSLFELLLFFGKDEFYEAPLKDILASVQECQEQLIRYDNEDLKLVIYVIKDGGPWENPVLQAILKGKSEPQDIVDKYLRSENQLFFELRVRYLIACERIAEAVALITTCLSHVEVSKNLYYHQAYFTCLHMTNLTDRLLHEHVLRIDCRDGVQIICNTEQEGKTVLALLLSEAFLITQLQTGEMYCIWDLIFIWSKLQLKTNPSKQAFVESCYQMLRIATNIKVIFPFIKTVINEVGEVGVQLAVELCGCALQLDLNEQPETKSLIYKTIAYLLPTDLEICRVCVLSVFFLERSIESYSAVERLYRCLDEDYNEFTSHVENRVRFELLPILKRGLLFDPEFWNFPMIQKKCAALLGEKAAMLSTNTLNTKVQETLNSVTSRMDLRNGVIGHRVLSGAKCENPIDKKSTLPILGSYKIDHNVPIHQCTLCNKEILGGHIFRHAQAHQKKGCFSCVLCSRKFRNRVKMLKHLKNHIKKMQIQPMTPSSSLDTNEINTSDPLENGNSSSSTNDTVMETPSSDATCQDHLPNPIVSSENHLSDCDTLKERHSEDLNTSANILSTILPVQQSLGNDLSACIKINGSLCPASVNEMVKEEGNYKCPAWGCFRLFKKIRSLNKHARIAHPNDIKVQQHLMKSNKGKCRFCQRRFADSKHFFDHLNRHVYPDVYFCQHLNCNIKFKLRTQLAEHILSHESFQAKCSYGHCPELFEDLSKLHEHECQHYKNNLNDSVTCLPDAGLVDNDLVSNTVTGVASLDHFPSDCAPLGKSMVGHALSENGSLGDLLDLLPSTENLPGICRSIADSVKENELLDLPVPVWKSRKDIVEPKTYLQTEKKVNGDIQSMNGTSQDRLNPLQPPVLEKICAVERNVCNDHEKTVERTIILDTVAPNAETVMKASSLTVIAPESSQESSADGNACNSKKSPVSFDQAYGGTVKRPYIRLLPPSYLDEQYISMPKRRKADERLPPEKDSMSKKSSERFRCGKCLTNYSSAEALNEHLAQKKCQLYFGFDSDDESAW